MTRFDPNRYLDDLQSKSFDRTLAALAVAKGNAFTARTFAEAQTRGAWRDTPGVPGLVKVAVDQVAHQKAASTAVTLDSSWSTAASAFLEPLRRASIIGRLAGARRRPSQASALAKVVGAGADWIAEGSSIPVYTAAFDLQTMMPSTVAGMVVMTKDFAELAARDDEAAGQLSADLRGAVLERLDATFASGDAAVAGKSPAGIAANATALAASGSTVAQITADLRAMVAVLTGASISLRSATWILSEPAYALFRLLKIADEGGTLAGLPVIASAGAAGSVLLVAAEFPTITLADVVTLQASGEGSVQMDSAPTNDSVTPTATNLVSLFQTNSVALRAVLYANWQVGGPTDTSGNSLAVVELTGASYL